MARSWLLALGASGCAWLTGDELDAYTDRDGDGEPGAPFGRDCDDADPTVTLDTELDRTGARVAVFADLDGDGIGAGEGTLACVLGAREAVVAGDCDDADPTVGVGRQQYEDADGDGFGREHGTVGGCEAAPGFSLAPGDCDDEDPDAHPGVSWFEDADGDGFGGERTGECARPAAPAWATLVTTGGDCDDADPTVRPGARDPALDGLDQDCGGDTDLDGDGDGLPDFAEDVDCARIRELEVASPDDLVSALAAAALDGACLHLALAAGDYGGGYAPATPTTVRPAGAGPVTFSARGAVRTGWIADAPLTLDRVGLIGFDDGAVRGAGPSILLGGVALEGGLGVRAKSDTARTLRLLGVTADGTAQLANLPGTRWDEVLLQRVRSRGAVASQPILDLTADRVEVRDATVSGFAVLADAIVLSAAGSDPEEDLRVERLALDDGILEGGLVIRPDDGPESAVVEGLSISGVEFVSSVRANVGVELEGPARLARVAIHDVDLTVGDLGEGHLIGLAPGAELDGAVISDVRASGPGSLVHCDGRLLGGDAPVVIHDAALGVSSVGVVAVTVDVAGGASIADATLVSSAGVLIDVPLVTGDVTVARSLLASSTGVAAQRVELTDSAVLGTSPPTCRPLLSEACCVQASDCAEVTDAGLLRFDLGGRPSDWDLRQRAGAPGCGPTTLPLAQVGALRRGPTVAAWYPDVDGDHLLDDWELAFLGPLPAVAAGDDPDGDGLSNRCELEATGSLPHLADTDADGVPDGSDPRPLAP